MTDLESEHSLRVPLPLPSYLLQLLVMTLSKIPSVTRQKYIWRVVGMFDPLYRLSVYPFDSESRRYFEYKQTRERLVGHVKGEVA